MLTMEVRGTDGKPGPARALEVNCKFTWQGNPSLLRDAYFNLLLDRQRALSEPVRLPFLPRTVGRKEEFHATIRIPLTAEAIRLIEARRNGADLLLRLEGRLGVSTFTDGETGLSAALLSQAGEEQPSLDWAIPQSEWVKRLRELEWDEVELFELSKLVLLQDAALAEALSRIEDAQTALRAGDWKGVLAKCRAAFESAAKHHAKEVKPGFAALLERAFPGDLELKRRADLNAIIDAVSKYAHDFGRHEQAPAAHVPRSEAEFVFVSTLAVFSMITRRISGREA